MDRDQDEDGIPDAADLCPTDPGRAADGGCPPQPDCDDCCSSISMRWIGFAPGSTVLRPTMTPVLDGVATELRSRADVGLVELGGRSRDGDPGLAAARSKAVMAYLFSCGVGRAKLRIGPPRADAEPMLQPIDRVEFSIVQATCTPGG